MKAEDQISECVSKIRVGHEAVEFNSRLIAKHGKLAIEGALLAGQCLGQAEMIIKGNEPWMKWCEKTFPTISYKTLSRYRDLHRNWTTLSNEDRDACETLNDAYLKCGINGGVASQTRRNRQPKSQQSRHSKGTQNSGDGANGKSLVKFHNANEAVAQIVKELNAIPTWDKKELANAKRVVEPIVTWYQNTSTEGKLAAA